jgi:ribosome-associated toxin RatA of RatAB toxin-antitoxin module
MFTLVDNVEEYPAFMPWCKSAVVLSRTEQIVEATLGLQRGAVRKKFTTRNTRTEFESIELALVDGPFRQLAGGWTFNSLGDAGSKVSLDLDFEFESTLVDMVFGSFFEDTCNSLVDSFTQRAAAVYGSS